MSKITTFYSYKGGSGRSMTMANVAWALATNGERVLAIDWDLEAPGIHRYFHPFLKDPEQSSTPGLVDRIWDYVGELVGPGDEEASQRRFALANCDDIVQPLELPMRARNFKGCLHLLGAGRQDDQYSEKVGGLDWAAFYKRFGGKEFVNQMMEWARGKYTHILIDSRTGVADTAGICTAQVPDAVVMCLVYNRQSIEGTAAVASSILKQRIARTVELHIVPCRVEERGAIESARQYTVSRVANVLKGARSTLLHQLRRAEIRHYAWCAFEEKLAVFEDVPGERGSLLDAMHELARLISKRDGIKIINIEPAVLLTYWRRAAFDDPRIAELESLGAASYETALQQISGWLDEAAHDEDARVDWLMSLGEAAVNTAGAADELAESSMIQFVGDAGLQIARRAYQADKEQYRTRFALVLQVRAAQLQKEIRLPQALEASTEALDLLAQERSSFNRWRRAQGFERNAELFDAIGRPEAALQSQKEAVELYKAIVGRGLPFGADIALSRSLRVLAEKLAAQGRAFEAIAAAEEAVEWLHRVRGRGRANATTEIVNVLATRAEMALLAGSPKEAQSTIELMKVHAGVLLDSGPALSRLDWRLRMTQARLLAQLGQTDEALLILDRGKAEELPFGADRSIEEAQIRILFESDRPEEALSLCRAVALNDRVPLSADFLNYLDRTLETKGYRNALINMLIKTIAESGEQPADSRLYLMLSKLLEVRHRPDGTVPLSSEAASSISPDDQGSQPREKG